MNRDIAAGGRPHADAGRMDQKPANRRGAGWNRRTWRTEARRVPEMDTRLVADFDRRAEIVEQRPAPLDHRVFGGIGQVAAVEIENIVIVDMGVGRPPHVGVPNRVINTAGDQPGVGHPQIRQARQDRPIAGIGESQIAQPRPQPRLLPPVPHRHPQSADFSPLKLAAMVRCTHRKVMFISQPDHADDL